MGDAPDRERIFGVLERLSRVLLSVGLLAIFVLIALAIALYFFDPLMFEAAADSPRNAFADQPRVFESTTTALGCAANATGNASVEGYQLLGARHLTVTGNITLSDASHTLTEPTVVERSGDRYVFTVETRPTSATERGCAGMVRYTAKVQLPYGAHDYELVINHGDNRTLQLTTRS